jgi:hypothetical protein
MINIPQDDMDNQNEPVNTRRWSDAQNDLITDLLFQIIRVKEIIKRYEAMPNSEGYLATSILNELVAAAHQSLVDYDIALMKKYYDLLYNCD